MQCNRSYSCYCSRKLNFTVSNWSFKIW